MELVAGKDSQMPGAIPWKHFATEVHRLCARLQVPMELFEHSRLEAENVAGEIALRLVAVLAGHEVSTETSPDELVEQVDEAASYHEVPVSLWDHIKQEILRTPFRSLFVKFWQPPQYQRLDRVRQVRRVIRRVTKHMHLCPLPAGSPPGAVMNFMLWDTPFEGSRAEYLAMREVAEAAREFPPQNVFRGVCLHCSRPFNSFSYDTAGSARFWNAVAVYERARRQSPPTMGRRIQYEPGE